MEPQQHNKDEINMRYTLVMILLSMSLAIRASFSDDVVNEMNRIYSTLTPTQIALCTTEGITKVDIKVFKSVTALNKEYQRLAKKYGWEIKRKHAYRGRLKITNPLGGFTITNRRTGVHTLYVPMDASVWAHELVHVVCGEWHKPIFK